MDIAFAAQFAADNGVRGLASTQWRGRRVTVMGLGTHGGGAGAAKFLARQGARVRLTDLRSSGELGSSLRDLRDIPFESVRLGWHDAADFRDTDAVVVNPAVPFDHPLIRNLRQHGTPILTEVGLLWRHSSAKVVAVTGSVGKSTTVSMIDSILRKDGRRTWLGGNIGGSLLNDIDSIRSQDWLVLELSSFQLASLSRIGFRPDVGVITNFSPNHLDWHGTLDEYRAAKQQMFVRQSSRDVAVLNADDGDIMSWPMRGSVVTFGNQQRGTPHACHGEQGIDVTGFHRPVQLAWSGLSHLAAEPLRRNAACAVAATMAMGASSAAILGGLSEFTPLPHRCESLGVHAGRRWINDSKGTTPAASVAAIVSSQTPWVILGGADKQIDLAPFCDSIANRISGAALLGETSEEFQRLLRQANPQLPLRLCNTMSEAVNWIASASQPGDVVLLSPACSSLDQFRDYADRGDQFREAVKRLDVEAALAPAA